MTVVGCQSKKGEFFKEAAMFGKGILIMEGGKRRGHATTSTQKVD